MAGASGLPLAGVEAIVEGLSSFQGDVRQMNSALDSIRPRSTLLQNAFSGAWDMVKDFGREILNVAEYALGQILADAIEFAIQKIGELVSATIEAGSEFQTLSLRLNGMNLQDITDSQLDYVDATEAATAKTREQLEWLQKIAAATPYDNTDISNVYTLSRSYGFADDAAKQLTESTTDFASAMGLEGDVLERIVMNFGQMVQRGKITSTEMRDLARGSFMPINDILQRIADNMNEAGTAIVDNSASIAIAGDKLEKYENQMKVLQQREKEFTDKTKKSTKMRLQFQMDELQGKIDAQKAMAGSLATATPAQETIESVMKAISKPGGGLPAELFIDAFNEMIAEEPRFQNASERMAKTFKAASDNAQDIVKSIGGLNIVKPVLDVIGGKIADFVSKFTDTDRWDRLVVAATRVGAAISSVVEDLFGLLPSSESLADQVVTAVDNIAIWIEENKGRVVEFFKNIGDTIREDVIPWIQNTLVPALIEFGNWVTENKPTILQFFETVGKIVGDFFKTITSQPGKPQGEGDILDSITAFMKFVIDNQEAISKWVEILWSVFIVWQVLATLWQVAFTIAIALGTAWLAVTAVFAGLQAVIGLLVPVIAGLIAFLTPLIVVILAVIATIKFWQFTWEMLKGSIAIVWDTIKTVFTEMKETVINTFNEMIEAGKNGDWKGVVTAIIDGIKNHFLSYWHIVGDTISRLFKNMVDAAKRTLGISSPSTVFQGIGKSLIDGLIAGINNGVGSLISAARNAALAAYNAAKRALGIASPSTLFFDIGAFTMEGFAQGIEKAAGMAVGAMQSAVGQVAVPAISSSAAANANGNTYHNNTEFNLNMTSNAQREPLLQDFALMQSLVGG